MRATTSLSQAPSLPPTPPVLVLMAGATAAAAAAVAVAAATAAAVAVESVEAVAAASATDGERQGWRALSYRRRAAAGMRRMGGMGEGRQAMDGAWRAAQAASDGLPSPKPSLSPMPRKPLHSPWPCLPAPTPVPAFAPLPRTRRLTCAMPDQWRNVMGGLTIKEQSRT